MDAPRTILVPFDFSEASAAAFAAAVRLHGNEGAAIVVQHVIDPTLLSFALEMGYGNADEIEAKARTHAEDRLRRMTEASDGAEIERMVCVGKPVFEILRVARELEADMIVLGVPPARESPERALFGSVAERVLRGAGCPVLVIPASAVPAAAEAATEPAGDAPSGAPSAL